MKWDIHVHSNFSDGISTIREIFEYAKKHGLDGLVITDHDFMSHWPLIKREAERTGVMTVRGVEITTPYGDILGIGIDELPSGSLEDIVESIRTQGGVSVAAHPFGGYWTVQFTELPDIVSLFDAWEILNGGVSREGNERAFEYGVKNKLVGTAGSDAHFKADVGLCWIDVDGDLVESIKKGKVKIGTRVDELSDLAERWNEVE